MTDNIPMLMAVQVFGVCLFLYAAFEKHRQRSQESTADSRPPVKRAAFAVANAGDTQGPVSPSGKPLCHLPQPTLTAEERHELWRVANWLTVHNRPDSAATLRSMLDRLK